MLRLTEKEEKSVCVSVLALSCYPPSSAVTGWNDTRVNEVIHAGSGSWKT